MGVESQGNAVSSADRLHHSAESPTADRWTQFFSRHFPTFSDLGRFVISVQNALWRRRRAIAAAVVLAVLSLLVLYAWWESVVGPQRNAVAAIRNAGGSVAYEWDWVNGRSSPPGAGPPWPGWLVDRLGPDLFGHVVVVNVTGSKADDALMTHIGGPAHLEHLNLTGTTLSGTGLKHLSNLKALKSLALPRNAFADNDLAPLAGLTRLKELYIPSGTRITSTGLNHLAGMWQLDSLSVINSKITTLGPLRGLSNLKHLCLQGAPITDEGLDPLEGFPSLQQLILGGSKVTDAGIAHFATLSNLVTIDLNRTAVGDAGTRLLLDLPRVTWLNLYDTRVTDVGLSDLAPTMSRRSLQSRVVAGPGITPAGVDALRKKLPGVAVIGPDLVAHRPSPRTAPATSIADEELPR